jgi:hypothetical protein
VSPLASVEAGGNHVSWGVGVVHPDGDIGGRVLVVASRQHSFAFSGHRSRHAKQITVVRSPSMCGKGDGGRAPQGLQPGGAARSAARFIYGTRTTETIGVGAYLTKSPAPDQKSGME